jgi:hypothetical protein
VTERGVTEEYLGLKTRNSESEDRMIRSAYFFWVCWPVTVLNVLFGFCKTVANTNYLEERIHVKVENHCLSFCLSNLKTMRRKEKKTRKMIMAGQQDQSKVDPRMTPRTVC